MGWTVKVIHTENVKITNIDKSEYSVLIYITEKYLKTKRKTKVYLQHMIPLCTYTLQWATVHLLDISLFISHSAELVNDAFQYK